MILLSDLLGLPKLPLSPLLVTGNFVSVGSEAASRGIVKNSVGDTLVTWKADMPVGAMIPWLVLSGRLIFQVAGGGQIVTAMEGYDRSWQDNASGTAWCSSNDDGSTPIISMNGDMEGPA